MTVLDEGWVIIHNIKDACAKDMEDVLLLKSVQLGFKYLRCIGVCGHI